jgi:hypothetical protein
LFYGHVVHFNLRHLLLFTTLTAAAVAATAALPTLHGALVLLAATLIAPGALATIAFTGGRDAKAFCLPAAVPLAFGLYTIAWALGWCVFQIENPMDFVAWFENRGRIIKTVITASWLGAALAGFTCLAICRARTSSADRA